LNGERKSVYWETSCTGTGGETGKNINSSFGHLPLGRRVRRELAMTSGVLRQGALLLGVKRISSSVKYKGREREVVFMVIKEIG